MPTHSFSDFVFRYWLDEYDTLAMDSALDANTWDDDYGGAETGAAHTPTIAELRALFELGYAPAQALRQLLAAALAGPSRPGFTSVSLPVIRGACYTDK